MMTPAQIVDQHVLANCSELIDKIGSEYRAALDLGVTDALDALHLVEIDAENLSEEVFYREPLEYWIVSSWLADQLHERGEPVARDLLGLAVWGRCVSGQHVWKDFVIEQIAKATK